MRIVEVGQYFVFFFFLDKKDQSVTHAQTKRLQTKCRYHRSLQRWFGPHLVHPDAPTTTMRELWQHCMRGGKTTGASMLAGRDLAGLEAHLVPWLWPSAGQKQRIRPTTCRPLRRRGQPIGSGHSDREAQGKWPPCRLATVRAAPLTSAQRGWGVPSRRTGDTEVVSTTSWEPWNRGNPSTTTSILRLSNRSGAARSMSWTLTLEDTRPPASRQTLAATDSRTNPLGGGH